MLHRNNVVRELENIKETHENPKLVYVSGNLVLL